MQLIFCPVINTSGSGQNRPDSVLKITSGLEGLTILDTTFVLEVRQKTPVKLRYYNFPVLLYFFQVFSPTVTNFYCFYDKSSYIARTPSR